MKKDLPEFKDKKEAQKVMHAILNVYNGVLLTIQNGTFSPFISYRAHDGKETEDVSVWCAGFVLGVGLFEMHEWDMFNDSDLAELCLPIFFNSTTDRLPEIYSYEQLKCMESRKDDSGGLIIEAVYDIKDYFTDTQTPPLPGPVEKTEPKIGRNDPCPCGSRKKYKKCCGGKK